MYRKMFLQAFLASIFIISCSDDDNDNNNNQNMSGKFLIGTTVPNADGMSGSSYIQLTSNFAGTIDNSKAIQTDFAGPIYVYGNDIFTFPSFGNDNSLKIDKYTRNSGKLTKTQTLNVPAASMMFNIVKVSDEKAYVAGYTFGKLWIVNPKTLEKIGEIDLKSYAHTDSSPEPSIGIVRDGKYYLPLNQIGANFMPYANYLQSDILVIDITTDTVEKMISENVSGLSFPTRPFLENTIFTNEQSDIYVACTGYFGINPKNTDSGFLCIPNKKQEFDTSKSWNISETTIEGTSYKPASVLNCQYIGNGKLVAFVAITELNGSNPYTSKNAMAVTIDLNEKTITKINGIPLTDGHSVFLSNYNDSVVLGINGENNSGFYTYNPVNKKVKTILKTVGNPVYFHSF